MKKIQIILLSMIVGQVYAVPDINSCNVHTWHDVISMSGPWKITLKMINQEGQLVDQYCQPVNNIEISPGNPLVYGFGFTDKATFDIAYTLTAVSEETSFQSKACVFVVTANGPAQPDITPISYHGAKCEWQVIPGVGENFKVS